MTPVDRSVTGEKVSSAGGHSYIGLTNNVLITGCTEISGSVVVIRFTPSGTAMSISGTDAGGVTSSAMVTLNLSSGEQIGGVSITSMGTITSF